MNKIILLVIFASLISCEKTSERQETIPEPISNKIEIGLRDSVYSEVLGEHRDIMIYTPYQLDSGKRYPTIYVLDGNSHFTSVVGIVDQMSKAGALPKMNVVAVPNTDRFRDLTPSEMKINFWTGDSLPSNGGGNNFLDFFEDELIPYLELNYLVSDHRTLIGHSLGGLFAIHTLVERPALFRNYIAIDPSLWWDNRKVREKAEAELSKQTYRDNKLFVAMARSQGIGMDTATMLLDTAKEGLHPRSIFAFCKYLEMNQPLPFSWKYYNEENHGSVVIPAEFDGLSFMFDYFQYLPPASLNPRIGSTPTTEAFMSHYRNHYIRVSEELGRGYDPPYWTSMEYADGFEGIQDSIAIELYELNKKLYPEYSSSYEELGDLLLRKEDTVSAIENYKMASDRGDKTSEEKLKKLKTNND